MAQKRDDHHYLHLNGLLLSQRGRIIGSKMILLRVLAATVSGANAKDDPGSDCSAGSAALLYFGPHTHHRDGRERLLCQFRW
jgi:hypothetical protein